MRALLRRSGWLTAALAVAVVAGCSDAGETGSDSGPVVRVLIADGNLRSLGEPCNGAGAFRSVHAEAGFVIENADGVEVAHGVLPGGTAEKLMDVDFREGMRQPTICVMEVEVDGLTTAEGHQFVVGDGFSAPIETTDDAGILGEVLVS